MTANDIRQKFLNFFKGKGHTVVASDSLVPKEDPTVLFTTAGMQQFKRQFLGDIDSYTRAASSQKCLRTDDLDEVGETAFHHTFFEMLGNFSFGDYFKKEAIAWAWEFLTKELGLPADKLWVSVYKDDDEAAAIWQNDIRIPAARIVRLGDKSNFWPSEAKTKGPNGPCGPCSEIFYDYGKNPDCKNTNCNPDCDCGRFSEVWNLVFTQFNRKDGGELEPLPAKNIDTGMGLERLVAVVQGKNNNFDTDLFMPIIKAIENKIETADVKLSLKEKRVIADHVRAVVVAINDGIIPSNKERGSVVKRLINDSTNYVLSAGGKEASVYKLVPAVVDVLGAAYPELRAKVESTAELIRKTEEAFLVVLKTRVPELKSLVSNLLGSEQPFGTPAHGTDEFGTGPFKEAAESKLGKIFFTFRDTYGLPINVITATAREVIPRESQPIIEKAMDVYAQEMDAQRERSRASSKMAGDVFTETGVDFSVAKTEFCGYDRMADQGRVIRILRGNDSVEEAGSGEEVSLILDRTPFYAESGGQVGDTGVITTASAEFRVRDTQKVSDIYIHSGTVTKGPIRTGDPVETRVDEPRRRSIMRNHTATHLLQAALRSVLGTHVQQQGSLVAEDRLRFDFTHPQALKPAEIEAIEHYVNDRVLSCDAVTKTVMPISDAKQSGALAFFAEKYGDTVRVVSIDDYSKEFCGGTHLDYTGQIGPFKITGESAIAQGIRRIEARTGTGTLQWFAERERLLAEAAQALKATPDELVERIRQQTGRLKQIQKDHDKIRLSLITSDLDRMILDAPELKGVKIIVHRLDESGMGTLRQIADLIRQKTHQHDAVVLLAGTEGDSAGLLITVSKPLTQQGIKADDLIRELAPVIGGSGGGRAEMAQAGSKNPGAIPEALEKGKELVMKRLEHTGLKD